MKLRTALPVATTLLLAALPSHGAIANGSSGNGELFLNVFDATAKVSYAYDIGIRMDDFYISGQPDGGTQRFWAVDDRDSQLFTTFLSLVNADALQWSVLAIDSAGSTAPGLQRLFTTIRQGDEAKVANQTNANLTNGFAGANNFYGTVNGLAIKAAGQSTHIVEAADQTNYDGINGSSYSLTTDSGFGYYGKTGGLTPTYNGTAPYSAANAIGKSAWFYYITRSGSTGTDKIIIDEFDNGAGLTLPLSGHDGYWGFIKVNDVTSPYNGKYLLSYTLEAAVYTAPVTTAAQREFAASIGRTELTGGSWVERLGGVTSAAATQDHSAGWILPLGAVDDAAIGPAAVSSVPEPGSAALLGLGATWLWLRRRPR